MPGRILLDNLLITDGTTTFRFFDASVMLQSWRPAVGSLRGGGTWRTPMFDDGSSLVMAQYDDITDVFELCLRPTPEDTLYGTFMDMIALLEKARQYWVSSYATEPVWVEAQGSDEANKRYATIKDWRIPGFGRGPFDSEFVTCLSTPNQSIQLTLVHAIWQSAPPLDPECMEISATQGFEPLGSELTLTPGAQADDGYAWDTGTTMDIASNWLRIGNQGVGILETGIRFLNVTVPQGSRITSAYIRFRASANLAGATVNCIIKAERNTFPPVFIAGIPGYVDMKARYRTTAHTYWNNLPAWVAGNDYDTPDISDVIQEIVDIGTWASGNDLIIFIDDHPWSPSTANAYRQARSWDFGANPPELHILYDTGTTFGRSETCDAECYVVNKHASAQLTNVYHYDASLVAWSANLMAGVIPFNLLPNPIQNGDIIYFGVDAAHPWAEPFSNLVFDIGTATTYTDLGAACAISWEYWDGGLGAWTPLTVNDNTSYWAPATAQYANHPFLHTGVDSVHWAVPSGWAQTTVTHPIDGAILGWWVRAIVALGGGEAIAPVPTQQNRYIYTCCWPFVETASDVIDGDIGALIALHQEGKSDWTTGGDPPPWNIDRSIQRLIIGARSLDRGEYFTPYLNCGFHPVPDARYWEFTGSNSADTADVTAPTGSMCQVSYAGATAALAQEIGWLFFQGDQWMGRFRVFMRYIRTAGNDGDIRVQLRTSTYDMTTGQRGAIWQSQERDLPVEVNEVLIHDFGLITLPAGGHPSHPAPSGVTLIPPFIIEVYLQNLFAGARVIKVWDLILMPADEFLVELRSPISSSTALTDSPSLCYEHDMVADSTVPKSALALEKWWIPQPYVIEQWISHNTGRMQLRPRKRQRLWWSTARADTCSIGAIPYRWRPEHEQSIAVSVEMAQRYLAVRGAR